MQIKSKLIGGLITGIAAIFLTANSAFAQTGNSATCQICIQNGGNATSCAAQCASYGIPAVEKFENGVISGKQHGNTNNEVFTDTIWDNLGSKLYTALTGGSVDYQNATQQAGALQSLGKGIAILYTPPANTQEYIADLMHGAGLNIAQPAYAQGLGFAALSPILTTWKVFRNIAYFFYVILFLVIGFMILFRQKIGNQAAVGVQQALPNIIISLLAVTFSYAIAGLMIDIMYLMMFFIVAAFQTYFDPSKLNLQEYALGSNIFQVGWNLFWGGDAFGTSLNSMKDLVSSATTGGGAGQTLGSVLGAIAGLTFAVVFAIALVFQIFRLFFELLKTYISIIISIVMSPVALMLGALPGNNAFGSWIKTLVANLAVFPAILIIIVLSSMLTGKGLYDKYAPSFTKADSSGTGGFLPPYLTGAGSAAAIQALLGLGILLILPDVAIQVKKSLGGSGGVFEQFANNFTSALDKGWKGGELIPGVGPSNTNLLGISGQNIMSKFVGGTKESNERVKKKQFNVLGRGAAGEAIYKLGTMYANRDIRAHAEATNLTKPGTKTTEAAAGKPTSPTDTTHRSGTVGGNI